MPLQFLFVYWIVSCNAASLSRWALIHLRKIIRQTVYSHGLKPVACTIAASEHKLDVGISDFDGSDLQIEHSMLKTIQPDGQQDVEVR